MNAISVTVESESDQSFVSQLPLEAEGFLLGCCHMMTDISKDLKNIPVH